jgi:oligopeptidase A
MSTLLENLPFPLPFDRIDPSTIVSSVGHLLEQAQSAIKAIGNGSKDSYEVTFSALETSTERLDLAMRVIEHLEATQSSPELRQAYNEVLPSVSAFRSGITLDAALYEALEQFAASPKAAQASAIERRFMQKTLEEFRREGARLDPEGKKELERIDRELSLETTRFSQNVLDSTNAFELFVDETRLRGLPPSAVTAAREAAEARGKSGYFFGLQSPSVVAVLNYADDRELRRQIWQAFNQRGTDLPGKENLPIVARIVELRRARARLLGFEHFADLATQDRMARSGDEASRFVEQLRSLSVAAFEREQAELLAFRKELEGPNAPAFEPWDIAYYAEKQRKALYDFDEEELRPYFSAESVLAGVFSLAERLYGVRVVDADLPVWHSSVRSHRLLDEGGRELGVFYTDLYPRSTKRDGAWMDGIVAAAPPAPHVALFCANAQPPTADAPSLMSFRDVETVFHEFGHLLHHMLSQVPVKSLACTRVAQDFVELPSQILENWCTEKEALDAFAKHYKTGETIPQTLVDKLILARNFRAATFQMRQLGFAAVDLALHTTYEAERDGDVNAFANRILQRYSAARLPESYALIASFGHLFSHPIGYAAGYYSYKWAEVLDADAFTRFKREGLFNRETGAAFRAAVLSRGGSAEPMDLFQEFMGREPRLEPMLERQGLL